MKALFRIILSVYFLCGNTLLFAQKEKYLVASYLFNSGRPLDDLGKHHPKVYGVILGSDRFGNSNSAYQLQGNYASFINLGTSNELKPRESTISLWFKMDFEIQAGKGARFNPIYFTRCSANDDYNDAINIIYRLDGGTISCANTVSELRQLAITSTQPVSFKTWHHVAVTYDDSQLSLYLDGKHVGTLNKNFRSQFLEGDSIMIGYRRRDKNERFFAGSVDDIQIYNKVLSADEIRTLYYAPNPNAGAVIMRWFFILVLIVAGIAMVFYLVRLRIKSVVQREKEKTSLKLQVQEQEIKMLKAQMDPHFIFNSLNTIQQFIVVNQNDKAELYLTKFSRLIRKILDSNTYESISLSDELFILKGYLEIESLRFNSNIDAGIEVAGDLDADEIFIPHMLIQPFVENAIWHGLRLKEGDKKLLLKFKRRDEQTLYCMIEDNGIGRQASHSDRERKSLGIGFVRQRLTLLSKKMNKNYEVILTDLTISNNKMAGTRVEITLPIFKNNR